MKLSTPTQMNLIDSFAINSLGIPGIVLMENAASGLVEAIKSHIGSLKGKKCLLFAGKGNNGGDALTAARHLQKYGACTTVVLVAAKKDLSPDALTNLNILLKLNYNIIDCRKTAVPDEIKTALITSDLVVDGIFGTGLKGEVRGISKEIIDLINSSTTPVFSIDIPSGLNGETGKAEGTCIKADATITFCLPKTGLVMGSASQYTGKLITIDIGIPEMAVLSAEIKADLLDCRLVERLLPVRTPESNKGTYGKVLIISGSPGMTGAGVLCGSSALRAGSGLVYLGVPASLAPVYSGLLKEAVIIPMEDSSGFLSPKGSAAILRKLEDMDAAAVGPGLSTDPLITEILHQILLNSKIPLILDADALNLLSRDLSVLEKKQCDTVITPHPGEMSRLTGISIPDILNNKKEIALEFSHKWNVITVLKGHHTIIAAPDGSYSINPTGNPGMATGGTGDALTGIIVSLKGQGLNSYDAARAGVFIHGLAGDLAAADKGFHGMTAGDLVENIPYAIKGITGKQNK